MLSRPHDFGPLWGRRILVTRPQAQADSLCSLLAEHHALPVRLPLMRIEPLPDPTPIDRAIRSLADFDWVVLTSANGVEHFWKRLAAAGTGDFKGPQFAAIGPATASALQARGVQPAFVPRQHVAEALAQGLNDVNRKRVLLPQAASARPVLAQALRARGALVEEIPLYHAVRLKIDAQTLAGAIGKIDAITLASSETARHFVTALEEAALFLSPAAAVACIGPITAQTARNLGLQVAAVAQPYTAQGLVDALLAHYATKQQAKRTAREPSLDGGNWK